MTTSLEWYEFGKRVSVERERENELLYLRRRNADLVEFVRDAERRCSPSSYLGVKARALLAGRENDPANRT
jgi:hypothetical protein